MEHLFYRKISGKIRDTLFMMTADHGQVEVNPKTTYYLNKHIAGIERYLRTNLKGRLLVPAGSARDMFLHVKDECTDEAMIFLQKHLEGRAEVYKTQELLAQGFFGSQEPSIEFVSRVGDQVILPYQNEAVGCHEQRKF